MQNVPTLSAVINTKNSEAFLETALESVSFVDEIIVVDMHSSDATQKIAKKFTNTIFLFDDVGYVEPARNFAISKATSDWILILDADEEVPKGLQEKITQLLVQPEFDAYYIPRSNEVFGYEMRMTGWWPDHQLRLFKRGVVTWSDEIHSVPSIHGTSEYLPALPELALKHHNYQNVSQFVDRMNRYTNIEAERSSAAVTDTTMLITQFKDELFRRLFYFNGIKEGMHGVGLSFLQAMYQMLIVLKIWEKHAFPQKTATDAQTLRALTIFQRELAYWILSYEVESRTGLGRLVAIVRKKIHQVRTILYAR